ncbi:MAG: hypothetical protein ABJA61_04455 [Caldimonas sp.]
MSHLLKTRLFKLLSLAALTLVAPAGVFAQNNSFATMIQNNGMWQANLTKQMINLGGVTSSSRANSGPAPCFSPPELARGPSGIVPPALQGDPRYQAYLRCRQGQSDPQRAPANSATPAFAGGQHLPITATDFVPVQRGHPVVDQAIVNMSLTPEQRLQLRNGVETLFQRVAAQYRGNNLAVSVAVAYSMATFTLSGSQMDAPRTREFVFDVNDRLAHEPRFALMAPVEKQNSSDGLIFQSAMISMLRETGARDPQARQQAIELSRVVLRQLAGS